MANEELLNEEIEVLELTDEEGNSVEFEVLDSVDYQGIEYLILLPVEDEDGQVVILEIEPVDEETENYLSVGDEALLNAVYDIFKEKYKDILIFED
jgi:uncharacterized protein YrzB (UPF0473 family)